MPHVNPAIPNPRNAAEKVRLAFNRLLPKGIDEDFILNQRKTRTGIYTYMSDLGEFVLLGNDYKLDPKRYTLEIFPNGKLRPYRVAIDECDIDIAVRKLIAFLKPSNLQELNRALRTVPRFHSKKLNRQYHLLDSDDKLMNRIPVH